MSFELGARQACDRRHRTMGTVHSGKISHLTWTFTKKYWAVLGCTGLYWAVLGHLRYLLGNVQVKWRILPLCNVCCGISKVQSSEEVPDQCSVSISGEKQSCHQESVLHLHRRHGSDQEEKHSIQGKNNVMIDYCVL